MSVWRNNFWIVKIVHVSSVESYRRQSWWVGGRDPRVWTGGCGLRNIIIVYFTREVCSKVSGFKKKIKVCPEFNRKWYFWKNENLEWMTKKDHQNFLPGKSEIFRKFPWKIGNFYARIHDPLDFKPDWRRCWILLLHAYLWLSIETKLLKLCGTNNFHCKLIFSPHVCPPLTFHLALHPL